MYVPGLKPRRAGLRYTVSGLLGLVCLGLLIQQLAALDLTGVRRALGDIPAHRWALACVTGAISLAALARYDLVAHRHLQTGVPHRLALRSGAASVAVGQMTGFGLAISTAVRWHWLPDLPRKQVAALSLTVSASFMLCWGLFAICYALPHLAGLWVLSFSLPPLGFAILIFCMMFPPHAIANNELFRIPNLLSLRDFATLSALDLAMAAATLFVLLPPGSVGFAELLAAYLLALGAGLSLGTPGGLGPFDLMFVTLLPRIDTADLAAGLLAYRLVYILLPGFIALTMSFVAQRAATIMQPPFPVRCWPDTPPHRPEHAIAAQAPSALLAIPRACADVFVLRHSLVLFLGARQGNLGDLLPALKARARSENRLPCLYKITARDAVIARRRGWHVQRFAEEAVLPCRGFVTSGPQRRQLRRALRKAHDAQVLIRRASSADWADLAAINADWIARHGRERGLTMGRYEPAYLADKPIYIACVLGVPVAFISCLCGKDEDSLDLMRHREGIPAGTMHALVLSAIRGAEASGKQRFSLAAIPTRQLQTRKDSLGLVRFKASFAPDWRPLYCAAPSRIALICTAADIWRAIRTPPTKRRDDPNDWDKDADAEHGIKRWLPHDRKNPTRNKASCL